MIGFIYFSFITICFNSAAIVPAPIVGGPSGSPVNERLIDEIPRRILGEGVSPTSTAELNGMFRAVVMSRVMRQPILATSYPLQPWRETILDRVNQLAADFAVVVKMTDPRMPAHRRAERLAEILAELGAVLANNFGGRGTTLVPWLVAMSLTTTSGVSLHFLGYPDTGFGLSVIGDVVGATGVFHSIGFQQHSLSKKLRLALRLVDYFWQRVDDILNNRTLSVLSFVETGTVGIARTQRSQFVSDEIVEMGCEELLIKR